MDTISQQKECCLDFFNAFNVCIDNLLHLHVYVCSVKGCRPNCTANAMAKHRKRLKRKRTSSTITSNSSCSSGRSSSSSLSSTTSSYETARKSKVRESKTAVLSAFRLQDKTRVLTQKPQFDPKDRAIVYSTMDATLFKRQQVFQAVSTKWSNPYCCLKPTCNLCLDHTRTSRAELMLDVIKVLRCSARSNKKKFHQIVDRILSST